MDDNAESQTQHKKEITDSPAGRGNESTRSLCQRG